MNRIPPTRRRALTDGFTLVVAWTIATIVAHLIAGHSECVLAYRTICGWWAVLFVCSKVDPKLQGLVIALVLWTLGSALDLNAHHGWLYPQSVQITSGEAARLIALNGVFSLVLPFMINRAVNFVIAAWRKANAE